MSHFTRKLIDSIDTPGVSREDINKFFRAAIEEKKKTVLDVKRIQTTSKIYGKK